MPWKVSSVMEERLSVCSGAGHMLHQAATGTVMSEINEVAGDNRSSLCIKNDRKNTSFWWGQQDFRMDAAFRPRETLAYIATLQWLFRRNQACISPSKSVEERSVSLDVRNRSEMRELCCHPSLHLSKAWDRGGFDQTAF
jgi:hypothetical protein